MLRSQKILIAVVLLLVAWLLHINMCDWAFHTLRQASHQQAPRTLVAGIRYASPEGDRFTGLIADPYAGATESLLLGVISPLLLVSLDVWLILGWRRSGRMAHGLCAHCGYDLRGSAGADKVTPVKCPECGLQVATATKHAA